MTFRVHVRVMPRRGLLDPQGQAVESALAALEFKDAANVHVGKAIELELEAADKGAALARAKAMCDKLLANPVTEDYQIEVDAA
ncbi:MAG: phosphoribosylformylglycinamidine synthase subunit PurS [Gemmatimonadales bacterium]